MTRRDMHDAFANKYLPRLWRQLICPSGHRWETGLSPRMPDGYPICGLTLSRGAPDWTRARCDALDWVSTGATEEK